MLMEFIWNILYNENSSHTQRIHVRLFYFLCFSFSFLVFLAKISIRIWAVKIQVKKPNRVIETRFISIWFHFNPFCVLFELPSSSSLRLFSLILRIGSIVRLANFILLLFFLFFFDFSLLLWLHDWLDEWMAALLLRASNDAFAF